ncbi:MAG: terminase small subunit [Desulfobacteraceae bacterium]|nr:terminase small subunit [Desulfobacteraceae bacterium]
MNVLAKSNKKLPRLSPRHHKFVEAYLTGQSIRQSAITAGYSKRSASNVSYRLLDNDGIAAHILHHQQLANEELQIKLKDVVPFLRKIRDDNKDKRPQVSVSACAELAKIGRLYDPAVVANIVVNHNALTVVHAPGALEAAKKEKENSLGSS